MLIRVSIACVLGLGLGLWTGERALRQGGMFDAVTIGPWRVSTKAGTAEADPYARAALERSGEIPLALGEGLQFVADADDDGAALDSRCDYLVGPKSPAARYWTLSLVDREGFPVDNAAERYGFRSSEVLRRADGAFFVAVSRQAHSGNWLPIGASGRFSLVFRLYDTPLGATAGELEKSAMPRVMREGC